MKRIKKIGVELEGGWDYTPSSPIYADGSVRGVEGKEGEICSPPLSLSKIQRWIVENYPSNVNSTCGFHIHISFYNLLDYQKVLSPQFYSFFLGRVEKWGKEKKIYSSSPFWDRLNGDNSYCYRKWNGDEQVFLNSKSSERYYHLNYCFSFHGTIECRLFPMFKQKELTCEAVSLFCEIVEEWLKNQPREKSISLSVETDNEIEKITIIEEVI